MGSMHSVSIMVDVSDEIFYNVVKPAKSEKKFKKLITNLLIAYANNSEVRKVVDGFLENDDLIGIKNLQEQVNRASQLASNVGEIHKSSLSSIDGALDEIEQEVTSVRGMDDEFKKYLDCNLKMQEDFMSTITNMLQLTLTSTSVNKGVPQQPVETTIPRVEEQVSVPVSVPTGLVFDDDDDDDDGGFEETTSTTNTEEELTDPNDFINNLLGDGNSFMG